jgi:energy-coupling factor transport system permease protein
MLTTTELWTPLVFIAFTLTMLTFVARIPLARLARILWPMMLIAFAFAAFYPIFVRQNLVADTTLLFQLGPLHIFQGGVEYGIAAGLRVLALLVVSLPFSLTTDSADFIRALVQQWRLPYRIGYSTLAAFRFIPMMQSELFVINSAHRVRGVQAAPGLRSSYERVRSYLVPLLASAIRQAERTALAMDGRAFGAFPERTYFHPMRFTCNDWIFLAGMIISFALILLLLSYLGLLGPLTLLQIL